MHAITAIHPPGKVFGNKRRSKADVIQFLNLDERIPDSIQPPATSRRSSKVSDSSAPPPAPNFEGKRWYCHGHPMGNPQYPHKQYVSRLYNHPRCQITIAAVIVLNFFSNIIEKQWDPSGKYPDTFLVFEDIFNWIFLIELLINAYGHWFRPFICSGWNIFDLIVVTVGCLSLMRVQLPGPLSLLRTLRAFRVFRCDTSRMRSTAATLHTPRDAPPSSTSPHPSSTSAHTPRSHRSSGWVALSRARASQPVQARQVAPQDPLHPP